MKLICKVPGRITVAEFKRAVKATGLRPVRGIFFEWHGHKLCGGCALTIVGVHRGYVHPMNAQQVPEKWRENGVPQRYVEAFILGFDFGNSDPNPYCSGEYRQGYADGMKCAVAVKKQLESDQ